MKVIDGGVTAPKGFLATGKHIGVKKVKKDLSLLYSQSPAVAAGSFTQNIVRAAPVVWNEEIVKKGGNVRGIAIVSGNANACTGAQGHIDNERMAAAYANALGVPTEEILCAATGVIGRDMPIELIESGIKGTTPELSPGREGAMLAAGGIITTDTFLKEFAVALNIAGTTVHIGAMAKGSGMIHPNMATVLAFLTTDMVISKELLQKALFKAVNETYNMISVDGAMSTNDMALLLANGQAGNPPIDEDSEFYEDFVNALIFINEKLATDIVKDGEGASKFITASVTGAADEKTARRIAKTVVTDNLVKTAMYGEDANWGRVVAAMGGAGVYFNPDGVTISFESEAGKLALMEEGRPNMFDENIAAEILHEREIIIGICLQDGQASAKAWGCDLNHEYVRINGEYRSRT